MTNEVYRDQTGGVDLGITNATGVTATFKKGGTEVQAVVTGTIAAIPYSIVQSDGEVVVEWKYTVEGNQYTRLESFDVVTPLFTETELKNYDSSFQVLTSDQVKRLERFIRLIIQNFTGQTFGQERGSMTVYGNGTNVLSSPKRIVTLSGSLSGPQFRVVNDGFGIESAGRYYPTTTVEIERNELQIPIEIADTSYADMWAGTIADPNSLSRGFVNNRPYTVTGVFGWHVVPSAVKEAALILAVLFSCKETTWRDRYVKTIRSADWQLTYDGRAFSKTGSVAADQLLDPYITNRVAVI